MCRNLPLSIAIKFVFTIIAAIACFSAARAFDLCKDYCFDKRGGEFRTCMESCNLKNTNLYSIGELAGAGLKCPLGMSYVPAGEFSFGCGEESCPGTTVKITRPFCIDTYEVTQGKYRRLMDENNSTNTLLCGNNCPVESVTWHDADFYCRAIGKRLPTEAEWEYAARGGAVPGVKNDLPKLGSAWTEDSARGKTHRVGRSKPNGYGIFDMRGNVWEWTADCYDETWFSRMPQEDPVNNVAGCQQRVSRGDAWTSFDALPARRYANYHNGGDQGFRCAWSYPVIRGENQ